MGSVPFPPLGKGGQGGFARSWPGPSVSKSPRSPLYQRGPEGGFCERGEQSGRPSLARFVPNTIGGGQGRGGARGGSRSPSRLLPPSQPSSARGEGAILDRCASPDFS